MAGILISREELMTRPTTGAAWTSVLNAAKSSIGTPNLSNMNDATELKAVACALAAVRLNDNVLRAKAYDVLVSAINTEENIRWLELGRNLGGWFVVADLLGITSGSPFIWLKSFMTKKHPHNNPPGTPETIQQNAWSSGSNASAQMGWVHASAAAYLGDRAALDWGWMAFRRYCGDRTSTWKMASNNDAWQAIPSDPVGIQNKGAKSANGINIDGAISNDMVRSNPKPIADLAYNDRSNYPGVGFNGAVLAAEVFHHAGYDAYGIVDKAILRAATYLKNLGLNWYDAGSRRDVKHLINLRYGVSYPCSLPVGASGLVGFSDFWAA